MPVITKPSEQMALPPAVAAIKLKLNGIDIEGYVNKVSVQGDVDEHTKKIILQIPNT